MKTLFLAQFAQHQVLVLGFIALLALPVLQIASTAFRIARSRRQADLARVLRATRQFTPDFYAGFSPRA